MPRGQYDRSKTKRRPRLTTAKPAPAEPQQQPAQTDDLGISPMDLAVEHLRGIHVAVNAIANLVNEQVVPILAERNEIAKRIIPQEPSDAQAVKTDVLERLAKMEQMVNDILAKPPRLLSRVEALEKTLAEKPKREPKVLKTEPAPTTEQQAAIAKQIIEKTAPKSEVIICKHIRTEALRPGLERCLDCGAVIDVPVKETPAPKVEAPAAQQTVTTTPAANGKAPSVDDVRAVAITYAQKHGKPKLSEVLKEFGASNLSTVPEESRGALMAKLQAGI